MTAAELTSADCEMQMSKRDQTWVNISPLSCCMTDKLHILTHSTCIHEFMPHGESDIIPSNVLGSGFVMCAVCCVVF